LKKDRTRLWFIDALKKARDTHGLDLWAYVIMPEHAHVLLFPRWEGYSLPAILKSIKQSVARRAVLYLRRERPERLRDLEVRWPSGRVEHRFWQQGGGYDRNVVDVNTAWKVVRYIHANPVRRGLVAGDVDWPWSSAGFYAGVENVLLEMDGCPE